MKFCGKYSGSYNKTVVEGGQITSSKGKATITIAEVGKGAYLVTIVDDEKTTLHELAYLEDDVLRAQAQSGEGVSSTYFEGHHLVHQLSNKSPTVWTVKDYKLKKMQKASLN